MPERQQKLASREAEQDAWIKFGISSERARIVHLFASACGPVDGDGLPLFGDAQLDAIAAHIDPAFARELYALNESNDTHPVGCSSCTASVASDEGGRCVPCQQAGPEHGLVEHRGWNTCPDLCGCATHGGQYAGTQRAEHGLVLPNGNTDTEKRAEDTECDRSVTPSREPLLAARDEARRAALDAYKDATPEQMVAMLAGVSVEDVRRLGGVPDGRFAHITDQDEIRQIVGDIPESSGFQKSETDLDHE